MTTASPAGTTALTTTRTDDGIVILTIDQADAVNKVDRALGEELAIVLDEIERDRMIRAAVLMSAKPDVFIAGADIDQFLEFRTPEDAESLSRHGQEMVGRLAALRVPVVAAIHGACLGGGLEIALACRWRIATDHPKTVLALPEVQLGIIPGMGGTQRLPRLVGLQNALSMILEGRNVRAKKALQMGLVDEMVHPAILRDIALRRAGELADGRLRRASHPRRGAMDVLLDGNPLGRSIVFKKAREQVVKKTHGHYPAPLAAIDVVRHGLEKGMDSGLSEEARRFGELALTEESRQLVFLFFATTALKKDRGVAGPAPEPEEVRKLGVLGAGFMGAGITSVAVQQGTLVRLKDTDPPRLARGLAAVRDVLKERLQKKQITPLQMQDMMTLAGATADYSGFADVDVVIEAVFEDLDLKHRVLREVEPAIPPDAVYASNTSTIPIGAIAEAATHRERVLGMHFFSPVHKMPLLEVIVTPSTDAEATVTAVAYGKRLGKTVIVVNDGPGFYTTRTLAAYMNEAGRVLEEGTAIEAIDKALVDFGFPVGPITLLDEVGIDVGGKVGHVLAEAFGDRVPPSKALERVVAAGRTGRKGRSGFYLYDEQGKKGGVDHTVYRLIDDGGARLPADTSEIVQRTVLAMVNEAARCLEEGILRSPRDGDVGAVFGIGFPPFRGGPFRYVDTIGAAVVVAQLRELEDRLGARFTPSGVLVDLAAAGGRFYPADGNPVE